MPRGTIALGPRRTGVPHKRSNGNLNASANTALWYKAWQVLLDAYNQQRLLSMSEWKRALKVGDAKMKSICDELSIHDLPIYEEPRGKFIYIGILYPLSVSEVKNRIEGEQSSCREDQIKEAHSV